MCVRTITIVSGKSKVYIIISQAHFDPFLYLIRNNFNKFLYFVKEFQKTNRP
jgi:hypothetical protein